MLVRRQRVIRRGGVGTDHLDHAVTLDAMAEARSTGGPLAGACGANLIPAALCAPPGRPCRRCVEIPALGQADRRRGGRHARPSVLQRLLARYLSPRDTSRRGPIEAPLVTGVTEVS